MRDLMKQYGWDEPLIPMNAKDPKNKLEGLFKNDDYIAEMKYDGSRYLCISTSEGGRFFSRKKSANKKFPELMGLPVEKTANVPHLTEAFAGLDCIVDGEVFYPGKKSNDVTKIMGATPDKALERQQGEHGWIHYMIYDILYYKGEDVREYSWYQRREMLEMLFDEYAEWFGKFIHLSEYVQGEEAKRALLKHAEDTGEEGIMLKNAKATYQCDKRPEHHWYKVKGEITADVIVMGYLPPEKTYTGKDIETWEFWEEPETGAVVGRIGSAMEMDAQGYVPVTRYYAMDWIGSVVFGLYKDGELVEVGSTSGMTDEVRKSFSDDQDGFIGQVVEIKAMERTKDGKFRHPRFVRFRDDKNAEDCLWENELD